MPPNNPMSVWGNEKTMNLNTLVLTNIQSSPYFKVNLFELKTYHEVIDEIYYKVSHLEPWEKGSRKTAGQTGMCGGVRGVGAGGIVSSAYCLLFKLFTLKLTKKQVIGLINHRDSPYIRGLGFMYIRYTQPPADLWPWYEDYLDDEEEIDVKAGGGHVMTIGEMLRQWLVKLEWYSTLFPRIPVPIEKDLAAKLKTRPVIYQEPEPEPEHIPDNEVSFGEAARQGGFQDNSREDSYRRDNYRGNANRRDNYHGDRNRDSFRDSRGDGSRGRVDNSRGGDSRDGYRGDSSRDRDSYRGDSSRDRDSYRDDSSRDHRGGPDHSSKSRGSPSYQRHQRSSPSYQRSSASRHSPPHAKRSPPRSDYSTSFERDLARERERQQREHYRDGQRSRSRSPRERKERRSRSRDRKEKKSQSKHRDREYARESSSHKRSHKDKKDKHRDRDEKAHKHKSRDKERR